MAAMSYAWLCHRLSKKNREREIFSVLSNQTVTQMCLRVIGQMVTGGYLP